MDYIDYYHDFIDLQEYEKEISIELKKKIWNWKMEEWGISYS